MSAQFLTSDCHHPLFVSLLLLVGLSLSALEPACDSHPEPSTPTHSTVSTAELRNALLSGSTDDLRSLVERATPIQVSNLASDLLIEEDDLELPERLLETAIDALGDQEGVLWLNYGAVALLNGQEQEALERYHSAVEASTPDLRAYTSISTVLLRRSDFAGAAETGRAAIQALPDDPISLRNLIFALVAAEQQEEATQQLASFRGVLDSAERAELQSLIDNPDDRPIVFVDRFPDMAEQARSLGMIAYEHGRSEEAIRYWRRSVRLDPLDEVTYADLGATLSELGRDAEALEVYEDFSELSPYNVLHYNHGNVLLRLERMEEAVESYRVCLEVLPSWVEPRANLVSALTYLGRFEEARSELELAATHGLSLDLYLALDLQLTSFERGP